MKRSRLNPNFVPIKVDREERPDLDRIYMQTLQAMTGQGGWPMNVFTSLPTTFLRMPSALSVHNKLLSPSVNQSQN